MISETLNGNWKLYYRPTGDDEYTTGSALELSGIPCVEAKVPGNCELDLSRAGILPEDLFYSTNIKQTEKYEYHEWWYVTSFRATEAQLNSYRSELCFNGVDCFADYFLNGKHIGTTENALIPHSFDVTGALCAENELVVHIKSAMLESHKYVSPAYSLLYANEDRIQFQTIRKPAHSFGWDIMPRCMTSGIWRGVEIRTYGKYEIDDVYIRTMYINDDGSADVAFCWSLKCDKDMYMRGGARFWAKVTHGDFVKEKSTTVFSNTGTLHVHIPDAKLWNPRGYGEANMYDVTMSLRIGDEVLTERKATFGIRQIELDRTDSADGKNGRFRFIVNGTPVFAMGTNWVPLDAFHSRDEERADKALEFLGESGCNMVRIWGGSVYECDKFYDYCDRHGIMVWQDFCMACNFYPQEEWFFDIIRGEALTEIKRLRNHPSIALWSGDNECDSNYSDSGKNPDENIITRKILPEVVLYNDQSRPYLASSPYISGKMYLEARENGKNPLDVASEAHLWGPRRFFKNDYYKISNACFVSETGYHGCPKRKSIEKFISPEKVWHNYDYTNGEWNLHSTSDNLRNYARVELMEYQIRNCFGELPDNLDDYAYASQISQAEAYKFFIERIRLNRPYCGGIIWWNLIDGWPEMSDAVVDYYYEKKLAFTYIQRIQKGTVVMMSDTENGRNNIVVSNITSKDSEGTYKVYDSETNAVISEGNYFCPANENKWLGIVETELKPNRFYIIGWDDGGGRNYNHYVSGNYPLSLEKYKEFLSKTEIEFDV